MMSKPKNAKLTPAMREALIYAYQHGMVVSAPTNTTVALMNRTLAYLWHNEDGGANQVRLTHEGVAAAQAIRAETQTTPAEITEPKPITPAERAEMARKAHYAIATSEDTNVSRYDSKPYRESYDTLINAIREAYPNHDPKEIYSHWIDNGESIAYQVEWIDSERDQAAEAEAYMSGVVDITYALTVEQRQAMIDVVHSRLTGTPPDVAASLVTLGIAVTEGAKHILTRLGEDVYEVVFCLPRLPIGQRQDMTVEDDGSYVAWTRKIGRSYYLISRTTSSLGVTIRACALNTSGSTPEPHKCHTWYFPAQWTIDAAAVECAAPTGATIVTDDDGDSLVSVMIDRHMANRRARAARVRGSRRTRRSHAAARRRRSR